MERITCLQAIFSRKNKVKFVARDGVESIKFGAGESSDKVRRFEERAFHEEPSATHVEMRTHDSSGPHEVVTAPLMGDWGKKCTACVWSDIEELEAAEAMKGCTANTSEFRDFDFPKSLIVGEDRLETLPQCAVHVDAVAEVAYEGGDEDEDSAGASDVKECESGPSFLEGADGSIAEDTAPGDILVDESARYYETQSNGAAKFDGGDERQFSDGEICFEVGNECASDPSVYNCKDSETACSPYFDPVSKLDHRSEDLPVVEMQGESLVSKGGSQRVTGTLTGHQVTKASCGSCSSAAEVHNVNVSDVVVKAVVPVGTSHSESALHDAKDQILNLNFSKEGKHSRPWWKVFLFTHRNIHRRVPGLLSGVELNAHMGYGSEVDYCDGLPCPPFLLDHPFQDKTSVGDGNSIGKAIEKKIMEERVVDRTSMNNFNAGAPPVAASSFTPITVIDAVGDQKLYVPHKPDLRHVEEWVNSIDFAAVGVDEEDIENDGQGFRELGSPTAPVSTFFSTRVQSAPQLNIDADGSIAHHSDGLLLGSNAEMAALVARSVNPLSTVAYFSGVGLCIVPPLALYNSLKTLNLSANHIVRITLGSLPRSLHVLDLSHNKIVVIEGLRELTRLRVLNLSYNRISWIGHGLAGCSSLRELHLAGNKISEIEGLHRLLKLSLLDLSFNKLTTTKAISQLAANYSSLQALNLLGNALNSNLGEEPLRKLVTGLAPHILYLNKQAVKAVSARDAAVDSVARAALGTPSHHHPLRGSKCPKGGSSAVVLVAAASASQGKIQNGDKAPYSANTVLGGYSGSSSTKEAIHKQQQYHHSQQQRRHSGIKEHALQSPGIWLPTPPAMDSRPVGGNANWMLLAPRDGMNRIRSDGSIYDHGLRTVDSPFA